MESAEADSNCGESGESCVPGKKYARILSGRLVAAASVHAAVEVISLNYRSAPEVLPLVKSMLSPEGRISADERTNSLIIVDSEEAIARIKQSLPVIDTPVRQALCGSQGGDTALNGFPEPHDLGQPQHQIRQVGHQEENYDLDDQEREHRL